MSFRRAASALVPRILRGAAADAAAAPRFLALAAPTSGGGAAARAAAAAPAAAALARAFRAPSAPAAADALADVLRNEIDYERQNYSQPEELATGPPAPFTLTETQGDTLLTLARPGLLPGEAVTVDVMVNDQPEEEAFEGEEGVLDVDVGVVFNVQVARGEESMVFECKSDGSYLTILHASLEPTDGEYDDSAYTGPVYEELDEAVQAALGEFLGARGVGPELGAYLLRAVHDKEQREYMHWLERVRAFVA